MCQACIESGHKDVSLPEDIADCPKCGLQCRSVDQVVDSDSIQRADAAFSQAFQATPPVLRESREHGSSCGSSLGINTHHIDWNHDNNEKSNLTTLCHHCHEQAHKLGKPLFDRLGQEIGNDQEKSDRLRMSSANRHREVYGTVPELTQLPLFQ